eukprot:8986515-Alexandrium_andersonii.AAC.1
MYTSLPSWLSAEARRGQPPSRGMSLSRHALRRIICLRSHHWPQPPVCGASTAPVPRLFHKRRSALC